MTCGMRGRVAAVAALAAVAGCNLFAPPPDQSDAFSTRVALQSVADGLTSPLAMAAPNDGSGRLFIADQAGQVRVIDAGGGLLPTALLDVSGEMVSISPFYDERGLLGLALHPNFADNGRFYVYYSAPKSASAPADFDHESHLSEFTLSAADANQADPASERILLTVFEPEANHNGGQLEFGPDGFLYVGLGDGGAANDTGVGHNAATGNGQDLGTLLGKILRIDVDGGTPYGVPADNPFVGASGALPEIWAYGFRNPWRFSFDSAGARELFVGDVGQDRIEEVDLVERGGNYGWRLREGRDCFDPDNPGNPPAQCDDGGATLIDPIMDYPHVAADGSDMGISVIGGHVYRGSAIPELSGHYVFGDFSAGFSGNGRLFVGIRGAGGAWTRKDLLLAATADGRLGRYLLGFGRDLQGELYLLTTGNLGPSGNTGRVERLIRAN